LGSTVAIFDDPAFVDTIPDSGEPVPESDGVQNALTNFGIAKVTFTDFTQVLETSPVIVIPEQENGDLTAALPGATFDAIRTFLNSGGTLIVHGGNSDDRAAVLINTILSPLGVAVTEFFGNNQGTRTYLKTGALPGTSFTDDPPSVGNRPGTSALVLSSLPPGATSLYSDDTNSVVAVLPYGSGHVIFIGRDWGVFRPQFATDVVWLPVLESAVNFSGQFTPKVPGDNFANSFTLPSTFVISVRVNYLATKEPGEPAHAGNSGGSSVWWNFTPTRNGMVTANTSASLIDTLLAVYVGTTVTNLTLIASDDDSGEGLTSRVSFPVLAGVNYKIAVDGFGGAQGYVSVELDQTSTNTLAVFVDPAFVDTSDGGEADNVQASLHSLGFPMISFTNLIPVLERSPVVVIPELETGNPVATLPLTDLAALQNFVRWGGTLIVHGTLLNDNTSALINTLLAPLGAAVTEIIPESSAIFARTAAGNGTTFADDPAALDWKNGTRVIPLLSLPPGSASIYDDGTNSAVTVFNFGSGRIIYFGWDWFDYQPALNPDVAWLQVLGSAASFSQQFSPAIANDNFARRVSLTSPSDSDLAMNIGASKESGEPNHFGNPGGRSLWWTWTAEGDGTVIVDTMGSSIDTLLAVYAGDALTNLTEIISNDDASGTLNSRVVFLARRGSTYQIAADGFNGAQGRVNLNLLLNPPSVAVFDDPAFVNTSGGATAESDSLQASLNSLTFPVAAFTNFLTALENSPVISIPALNVSNLAATLDGAALTAIRDFLTRGGSLIVHGSVSNNNAAALINSVLAPLGAAVTETSVLLGANFSRTAAADGTTFTNAPPLVPANDGTKSLAIASLPPGSASVYSNGGESSVAVMPFGAGRVIFLGWNWRNAQPLGSQNNGWLPVLASAVTYSGLFLTAQPNDEFRLRTVLTGTSTNLVVSNVSATREPGEPLHGGLITSNSIWFSWTAPANGGAIVEAITDFPFPVPMIAVYTGTNLGSLTNVT
ncbi:MAG: hypothetical protein H7Y43_06670, partial [Akkermansiaceae bacterium]|nr:hypothetical protein [Verrucomicrobiales bacterium]